MSVVPEGGAARRMEPSGLSDRHLPASYAVLGGVLGSELPFPELPAAPGERPTWRLCIRRDPPPAEPLERLGERTLGPERYTLWRRPDGFRLQYSHAGTFDLSGDGSQISWYPVDGASTELARAIVLGPVLALALELAGELCLHGSAVAVDGGAAIGFLGGKFHGKSTLATALTAAGARLVSDDILAVEPSSRRLRPGVLSVRLWEDAAAALRVETLADQVMPGVKTTAAGFARQAGAGESLELRALYLLTPELGSSDPRCCWRTPEQGAGAAVGLAHQTKLPASLVGTRHAAGQLRRAAAAASVIPVWRLHVVRDLGRIQGVAEQILAWHGPESGS